MRDEGGGGEDGAKLGVSPADFGDGGIVCLRWQVAKALVIEHSGRGSGWKEGVPSIRARATRSPCSHLVAKPSLCEK